MKIFQFMTFNIDGFIMIIDAKIKHLVLFDYGLLGKICDKIKYLISMKIGITNSINFNFGKIKIDSCNSLPINKTDFHNVTILIKSIVNKNKNKYYYDIFLEKGLHKDKQMFVYYKCYIMIELTFF